MKLWFFPIAYNEMPITEISTFIPTPKLAKKQFKAVLLSADIIKVLDFLPLRNITTLDNNNITPAKYDISLSLYNKLTIKRPNIPHSNNVIPDITAKPKLFPNGILLCIPKINPITNGINNNTKYATLTNIIFEYVQYLLDYPYDLF